MSGIKKIRVGEGVFNITPEIGKGLQFGTGIDNSHVIYVNIGEAVADNAALPSPGLKINHLGFTVDSQKFKAFLEALGFKTV